MPEPVERTYELPRVIVFFRVYVMVVGPATVAGAILGHVWWFVVPSIAITVWVIRDVTFAVDKRKVHETERGLVIPKVVFGTTEIPWADLASFNGTGDAVFAHLRTGKTTLLLGMKPNRARWNGGETRDTVGELNARLQLWQAREQEAPTAKGA
jgi:hypothetical protein